MLYSVLSLDLKTAVPLFKKSECSKELFFGSGLEFWLFPRLVILIFFHIQTPLFEVCYFISLTPLAFVIIHLRTPVGLFLLIWGIATLISFSLNSMSREHPQLLKYNNLKTQTLFLSLF